MCLLGFQSFVCFTWEIYDCYYYYYYYYCYLVLPCHHCKIPADSITMGSNSCFWWKKCKRYISWPNICCIFLSVSHHRHQHRLLRTQNLSDSVYKQKSLSSLRRRMVWIGRFVCVCVCVGVCRCVCVCVFTHSYISPCDWTNSLHNTSVLFFSPVGWISTVWHTSQPEWSSSNLITKLEVKKDLGAEADGSKYTKYEGLAKFHMGKKVGLFENGYTT